MTLHDRFVIKVPSSTANLGPGFDSIGLALNLYLTLEIEKNDQWECYSSCEELKDLPTDESHFICQVAIKTAANYGIELPPCKIKIESEIPLARGLGSSAAAIVAGIELADAVGGLRLTKNEKLLLATKWEGHPDNVGASLFGGLVIGRYDQHDVDMLSITDLPVEMVTVIPKEILLTKESRDVLPAAYSRQEAVQASSTANLLIAALVSQNWNLAGKMMGQDRFHQPYRQALIHFYQEIESCAKSNGAFGVALSGAGPTVICFSEKGKGQELAYALGQEFPSMTVKRLSIDYFGSCVKEVEEFVK
ncbi:homoserine kinase [Neobacillus sp. MM2021_6]|uniref:homoserine kinase n=1 Tax=Bacillaceae TaxID=186817 RepID=UPI00140D9A54|nr:MULTISPECIES: homoserine kinase [Bacillaceae]MBO0962487.1 homoserine kinase [Neobacillus sp. MM2021_6]NHC19002.1 homoserine kinase [Bacillus sp. MM2020_4]